MNTVEFFPDKTQITEWFYTLPQYDLENLGKPYIITDFGVLDDGKVHTNEFQSLIDTVALNGGGVIVVPEGTFITGALYFKEKVNLYI